MKNSVSIVLVLCAFLSVTACGGRDDSGDNDFSVSLNSITISDSKGDVFDVPIKSVDQDNRVSMK